MTKKQLQAIAAYRRAQGFLNAHPLPEPATYGAAKETLDDVIERLATLGTSQLEGGRRGRNETARQQALTQALREQHLRPIGRIARAALRGVDGAAVALRTPDRKLSLQALIADAKAVRKAVEPHQEVFVRHSLPADFLARLDGAIAALEGSITDRADGHTASVGAGKGLVQEIRRGRDALEILDVVVEQRFAHDDELLGKWRAAKRVHVVPVTSPAPAGDAGDAPRAAA